jgi:hypothetical protein
MLKSKVHLRVAVLLIGAIALFVYVWVYLGNAPQYEVVQPGVLYRAVYTTPEEYINAADRSNCKTACAVFSEQEFLEPPVSETLGVASKAKIRYAELRIPKGGMPTAAQVDEFFTWMGKDKNIPMLLISPTGERTAMLAAAYRLGVMHLSLGQTLAAIDKCDSPDDVKRAAKAFAQSYAAAMQHPATTPTTRPAP